MIGVLDILSTLAFLGALLTLIRVRDDVLPRDCRVLLGVCLAIYALVGFSNILEHTGVTAALDLYEDYLELLFIPFFAYFVYAVGTNQELRGRIETEKRLRRSEQRYRTLVENVDLGITLVDADHRVVMTNRAQAGFFGREPAEFIGRHCFREFENRGEICPHCPGILAMETGTAQVADASGVREDGVEVPVRIRAFPLLESDGSSQGFIEVVEDVTREREAEEERLRLETQMQHAQKLESLGVLAGGIAHDFNNLLMGILGNADLAQLKLPVESPALPYVRKIITASERAAELTNQMLAYSGKGRFVVEPLNLSRIVEEMVHLVETVISKKAVLRFELTPDLPHVEADATQIRQIILNLITNASDAIGERSGVITVSTGAMQIDRGYFQRTYLDEELPEGPYAFLEVADTGTGMDEETRSRVFEPFFTTKFTGRGLGLAAVLGIVRSHRGAIRVYSEPGHGSTFKVLLPCSEPAERVAAPDPSTSEARPREGGTVLVVDDEETVRVVAAMMLEECGFRALKAADGREALEIVRDRAGEVDVVLLDMTMPHLSGEETFRELRRLQPGIKVVLSSGHNEQSAISRFAGKGLAGFIQKPYGSRALVDKIGEVLRATTPPGTA